MVELKFKTSGITVVALDKIAYAKKLLDSAEVPKDQNIYMRKGAFNAFIKALKKDGNPS